jgi:hypothetical protein
MIPFEWLAVVYFAALGMVAPRSTRWPRGLFYASAAIALIIVARFTLPWTARAWLAHAYLVFGYWIPAAFVAATNYRFERWLALADSRLGAILPLPRVWHVSDPRVWHVSDPVLEL